MLICTSPCCSCKLLGCFGCTGICPLQQVVCVVVDECHRAVGKYDIVPALQKLRDEGVRFRVLGLSATPGSKKESIQVRS